MESFRDRGHDVTVIVRKIGTGIEVPDGVTVKRINMSWVPRDIRPPVFDSRLGRLLKREPLDFVLSLTKSSHQDAVLCPGNHIGFLKAIGKDNPGWKDRMHIRLERRSFDSSCFVLAASAMMKDELIQYYQTAPEKIRVLFPPIDDHRFHQRLRHRREELRRKHGFSPGKKSFVFISVSHGRKGLPVLLRAFETLREEPCELLVAGPEPVKTDLPNVRHLGWVRETEELYAAADGFLLPARYEPFGQVVAESILCGTPVVISHMVGAKEVVTDAEGLVVDSFDTDRWVEAIREVSERSYAIDSRFAERNGLRLSDHVDEILQLATTGKNYTGH